MDALIDEFAEKNDARKIFIFCYKFYPWVYCCTGLAFPLGFYLTIYNKKPQISFCWDTKFVRH